MVMREAGEANPSTKLQVKKHLNRDSFFEGMFKVSIFFVDEMGVIYSGTEEGYG